MKRKVSEAEPLLGRDNPQLAAYQGKKSDLPCWICNKPAPWMVFGGKWRPVCRRHFVVLHYDHLKEDRAWSWNPQVSDAFTKYTEEQQKLGHEL